MVLGLRTCPGEKETFTWENERWCMVAPPVNGKINEAATTTRSQVVMVVVVGVCDVTTS